MPAARRHVGLRHGAHGMAGGVEALEEDVAVREAPRVVDIAVPRDDEAAARERRHVRQRRGRRRAGRVAVAARDEHGRRCAAQRGVDVAIVDLAPRHDVPAIRERGQRGAVGRAEGVVHLLRAGGGAVRGGLLHVHGRAAAPADDERAVGERRHGRHGGVAGHPGVEHVLDARAAAGVHDAICDLVRAAVVQRIRDDEAAAGQRGDGRLAFDTGIAIRRERERGARRIAGRVAQLRPQACALALPDGDDAAARQGGQRRGGRPCVQRCAGFRFVGEAGQAVRRAVFHRIGEDLRDARVRERIAVAVDLVAVVVVHGHRGRQAAGRQLARVGDHQPGSRVDGGVVADAKQARLRLALDHPAAARQVARVDPGHDVDDVARVRGREHDAVAADDAHGLAVREHGVLGRDDAAVRQLVVDAERVRRRPVAGQAVLEPPQRAGRRDVRALAIDRHRVGEPRPAVVLAVLHVAAGECLAQADGRVEGDGGDGGRRGAGRQRGAGIAPGRAGLARTDIVGGRGSGHGVGIDSGWRERGYPIRI